MVLIKHFVQLLMCVYIYIYIYIYMHMYIQDVLGGIVNILGGGSIDCSEQISSYKHVLFFNGCEDTAV